MPTKPEIELKRCCDGWRPVLESVQAFEGEPVQWRVTCYGHHIHTFNFDSPEEAAKVWNALPIFDGAGGISKGPVSGGESAAEAQFSQTETPKPFFPPMGFSQGGYTIYPEMMTGLLDALRPESLDADPAVLCRRIEIAVAIVRSIGPKSEEQAAKLGIIAVADQLRLDFPRAGWTDGAVNTIAALALMLARKS